METRHFIAPWKFRYNATQMACSKNKKWVVPGTVPLTLWSSHFNLRLISVAIIITLKQDMHFLLYIDRSDMYLDVSVIIVPSSEQHSYSIVLHCLVTPLPDTPPHQRVPKKPEAVLKNLIYLVCTLRKPAGKANFQNRQMWKCLLAL